MSIENIIERILSDAEQEAKALLSSANREKEARLEKARRESGNIQKEMETKALLDAKLHRERRLSVAELEARKLALAAKQEAIAMGFEKALAQLSRMEPDRYIRLLADAVKATGMTGGELLFNPADRESIGQKVVDTVNAENNAGVTLSSDTIEAKGGFVLRKGDVTVNATLETMLSAVKEQTTPEVVKLLFE